MPLYRPQPFVDTLVFIKVLHESSGLLAGRGASAATTSHTCADPFGIPVLRSLLQITHKCLSGCDMSPSVPRLRHDRRLGSGILTGQLAMSSILHARVGYGILVTLVGREGRPPIFAPGRGINTVIIISGLHDAGHLPCITVRRVAESRPQGLENIAQETRSALSACLRIVVRQVE